MRSARRMVAAIAALIVGTVFAVGQITQDNLGSFCASVASAAPLDAQGCDGSGAAP